MTRTFKALLAAAAIAVLVQGLPQTAGAQSSPSTGAASPLGGINVRGISPGTPVASIRQEIAWARALHARLIRTEIPWSTLEPVQGQIEPKMLALTDYLVNQAAAAGIKVVALTMSTPCWASSAPPAILNKCRPYQQNGKPQAWAPTDPSTYASFAAFLAARYGPKLAAIEVWNEPDQANEDYFAGPEKAQRYAALLRAAYPAIKHADPQMTVLGGSFVGVNGTFLKALYAAGIKGYYDGLSVHFYNLVLASLRYIHEVQLANGDTKPLWLDEFGWSSCWPRQREQQEQGCVTKQAQARNIANVFHALARTPWVAAEMVYTLQGTLREDFGVLTETGARKPSFNALRSVLVSPLGNPSPVTLHLARGQGRILASGEGPAGDYLQLEVSERRGRGLYRVLFKLNRFNRYAITLPRALGMDNLRVQVFQYWRGASTATSASI